MRTRHFFFLVLTPALPLLGASFGLGCGNVVTLQGYDDGGPGGGGDATINPDGTADIDGEVLTEAGPDVFAPALMTVDGIPCTSVTEHLTTLTAPDGKTWTLNLHGICGSLGPVDVFVASKDDIAYPQGCGASTRVQMFVPSEGDSGSSEYTTDLPPSSCNISSGPSTAEEGAAVNLTAKVANSAAQTHLLNYQPSATPKMVVQGVTCVVSKQKVTTKFAPDGQTWTLDLSGVCGTYGTVDVYARGKDNVAYPQTCVTTGAIQMSVGSEGDAGMLAYDTFHTPGACAITSGPTTADETTKIALTATLANTSAATLTLQYVAP
jgi:hypothetical protein